MTNLFKVEGQTLTPIEIYPAVSDTVNYLTFAFMFSYDWAGLTKSAIFTKGTDIYEVVLTDDEVLESDHVNLSAGVWDISVVGDTVVDAVVTRQITTNSYNYNVTQASATSGGVFPPSIASQVYVNTNQATPQTFVGGIPRLAADRVIENENDMVDAKHVADTVATVTADDFAHNSLSSLQGGGAKERYHMTQAENAALHAHLNKTALDAVAGVNTGDQAASSFNHNDLANKQGGTTDEYYHVTAAEKTVINNTSGTNTGDEDAAGKVSTHNADAGAHSDQFEPINTQLASDAINHMVATEFSGAYEGVDLAVRFATEIDDYSDVWAWIKARTQAENFAGLHVHDYIISTCSNPGAYVLKTEISGINTYKGSGGTEIPAHIDWISKDCWPDTVQYNLVDFNNGIGCDKFTATAGQTAFQLTYRGTAYPSAITSMTINGTANTDFTYASATGIMTYTGAALSAGAIVKAFREAVSVPFMASNLNAYMNSLKMGVPNEAALDPFLTEVDFSAGGIYYYLPAALKAVITKKRMYAATRYTAGSLLTASNNFADVEVGYLWVPEEMEICGSPLFATGTYDKWYARQYPCFAGGNRKKGAGNGGSRASWWEFSTYSGTSTSFCCVSSAGGVNVNPASNALRVPVGFRIAKT